MTENDPSAKAANPAAAEAGIVCAKCEELNPAGSKLCTFCGAHLFVTCHRCGHRNQRILAQCAKCGSRLHRSARRHWYKRLFPERGKFSLVHVVLILIVTLVAYLIIVKVANGS